MYVIKRNGQREPMRYDKITDRNVELAHGLQVDVAKLSQSIIQSLKNGMTTEEIDLLSAETAFFMSTYEPDFDTLSSRIAVSNLHKTTSSSFLEVCTALHSAGLLRDALFVFVQSHAEQLQTALDFSRDYDYNYFGFKTMEKAYLLRIGKKIVERPQHMLMRVSVTIHADNLNKVIECYRYLSKGFFSHASPTLFNAGMEKGNLASCFLLHMEDDLKHIFETNMRSALISKYAGGIGIDISSIRAKGSVIKSTNGKSDGIVPMIKVFNATSVYSNQCFTPETVIYTRNGPVQIKDVSVGDEVITMDGSYKPVVNQINNMVKDEILRISVDHAFEPIGVTKEHQIFTIASVNANKPMLTQLSQSLTAPMFTSAGNLTPDHYLGFPLPMLLSHDSYDAMGNDFFRFYGLVLRHGTATHGHNMFISLTRQSTTIDAFLFLRDYFQNKNIPFKEYKLGHSDIRITWSNINSGLEYEDIYNAKHEKRIHPKYLNISRVHRLNLVKGFIETSQPRNNSVMVKVNYRELAHNIRFFLQSLGVLTSGFVRTYDSHQYPIYHIIVPSCPAAQQIHSGLDPTASNGNFFVYNNMIWTKIKSIRVQKYEGPTYDLSILNNNNYTVGSLGLVHNSGKRKGSFAMYLQPFHPDILDFLGLRLNVPPEELRARDIFLALWIPDIFMKRVEEDGVWSLICPSTDRRLCETYGEEFEKVYLECEAQGKYTRQLPARDVWKAILHSQQETGMPYMLYKDSINRKSMQKNIGIIRSSNLCVHGSTTLLTRQGYVPIQDLVGQDIEIWNGFEWTLVQPVLTGSSQKLLKIHFDNGESVMVTEYHNVPLVDGETGTKMVKASDICSGDTLSWWIMPSVEPDAEGKTIVNCSTGIRLNVDVRVITVEEVPGEHDTYCFTDPKRGLGVFNKVLLGNCAEIVEYTDPDQVAVCNLAAIVLNKFIEKVNGKTTFQWDLLGQVTQQAIENLNRIIDINFYSVEQAKKNNIAYRPVALGIMGLSNVFFQFKTEWGSDVSRWLNRIISEVMYYNALLKSAELAETEGPYDAFEGSPVSEGKLQYHLWYEESKDHMNHLPWTSRDHPMRKQIPEGLEIPVLDWEGLIEKCKKGVRNSLLLANMPTASTASIKGVVECFEPITSNIYSRSVLAGDFVLVNKDLYQDLNEIGLWTKNIVDQILESDGSIEPIAEIPDQLKQVYKTVWEISQRTIIDFAADRAPFIDQTQSMNLFLAKPSNSQLSSMHLYGWKKGLKTGSYYLRSQPAKKAVQFTIMKDTTAKAAPTKPEAKKRNVVCNDLVCTSCSV